MPVSFQTPSPDATHHACTHWCACMRVDRAPPPLAKLAPEPVRLVLPLLGRQRVLLTHCGLRVPHRRMFFLGGGS